MAFSGESWP